MAACPEWRAHVWELCSATCGGGQQLRLVTCHRGEEEVEASFCDVRTRPEVQRACGEGECPVRTHWFVGEFLAIIMNSFDENKETRLEFFQVTGARARSRVVQASARAT